MKSVEITDAAVSLAAYVRGARKHPLVLSDRGKPVAATWKRLASATIQNSWG
jgi:hypothetical protein